MRSILSLLLMFPVVVGAQGDANRLTWVPNPRTSSGGWVSDPAHHLAPATVSAINATVSALESETSAEIGVAVLDSLDGLEPGAAALLLHRRWGVGKAARDNGVLLLWSPAQRKIFVSVGYGLEGVLSDARAGRIQDDAIIPHFRRNEFDQGIIAGVNALASAAREETYSGATRARIDGRAPGVVQRVGDSGAVLGGIFGTVFALIAGVVVYRRRPRKCPHGHGRMTLLSETQDDRELTNEEVLEENIRSMNYHVWVCGQCPERIIVPRRRWFTSYSECPECKRRTLKVTTKTTSAATYHSTGTAIETRKCRNCSYNKSKTIILPMLTRSSSSSGGSSGGGGSSFGGGSSGGGGAGRSY
jgi:uncharacterized protein